jgi:hypothetical protein
MARNERCTRRPDGVAGRCAVTMPVRDRGALPDALEKKKGCAMQPSNGDAGRNGAGMP